VRKVACLVTIFVVADSVGFVTAQEAPESQRLAISVTSTGKAVAKADLAIVFLNVSSTSPPAADALSQNNKKLEEVKARLTALGYKDDQVKFSGNRFSPAGGGMYYGPQRPTGFDVYRFVFIRLDGPELKDMTQLNARVSSLLDGLSKLGATPYESPISRVSMGGASLVALTVKGPSPFAKEAYLQAIEKARPIADDIARRTKVQITGVDSVVSVATPGIQDQFANPLDELPYQYFSSSVEEIPVQVSVSVRYAFK